LGIGPAAVALALLRTRSTLAGRTIAPGVRTVYAGTIHTTPLAADGQMRTERDDFFSTQRAPLTGLKLAKQQLVFAHANKLLDGISE
jgi:hypothetical protein